VGGYAYPADSKAAARGYGDCDYDRDCFAHDPISFVVSFLASLTL
jgi:hypothetical protein